MNRCFYPLLALVLGVVSVLPALAAPIDGTALATLAIQDHGRKKPFTTFAQETLLALSGSTRWPTGVADDAPKLSANEVLLDLWLAPENWDEKPLIYVNLLAMKQTLGFPPEQKLFAYRDLAGRNELLALVNSAQAKRQAGQEDTLTPLEKEAERLTDRLQLFLDCVNGVAENIVPNPAGPTAEWQPIQSLGGSLTQLWPVAPVAPAQDSSPPPGSDWVAGNPQVQTIRDLFLAWAKAYPSGVASGDFTAFNLATAPLVESLRAFAPSVYPSAASLRFEHHYLTFHPFRWAWITYLLALLVLLLTSTWLPTLGYRLTWVGVLAGLGFAIYGFACRIIISGRPPVTDMYETVVWVSFVAMLLAVVLESIYRRRWFFYAGLPASILTLIVADSQPTVLDASIHPLTAVLRNNLWLTIHVLTIVSSYGAFVLAAALGHVALGLDLSQKRRALILGELHFFIYRAIQVGVLLLATGTILGGVWANYSWGRFWGWDPKETWALITLLCYLALLHGRLAGWWSGFGLALGSVICFLSVLMSWYGVNYVLGKGLHSYGFGTGGFGSVAIFVAVEVALITAALLLHQTRKRSALA